MMSSTELRLGGRIDGFDEFSSSAEKPEADMSLYRQTRDSDRTLVAGLHCQRLVLPTGGRREGAEYDVELTFAETPRGDSRRVTDTGAVVEFWTDFYGSEHGEAFFLLCEMGGTEYRSRMGSLALKLAEFPSTGSLPVDITREKRETTEGPLDTCYLTVEFDLLSNGRK